MLNDKLKNMKLLMLKTFILSCLITGSMFAQEKIEWPIKKN